MYKKMKLSVFSSAILLSITMIGTATFTQTVFAQSQPTQSSSNVVTPTAMNSNALKDTQVESVQDASSKISKPILDVVKAPESMGIALEKKYPNLKVKEINFIKDIDLYEIRTDNSIAPIYTNASGTFMLVNGQIVDPDKEINISEVRKQALLAKLFNEIPVNKGFKKVFGNGERQIIMFSDPRCPYCRRMELDLMDNLTAKDNVTINYLMAPLDIKGHEDAPEITKRLLCSTNPDKLWDDWMLNQKTDIFQNIPNDCAAAQNVAQTKELFLKLGFRGTPSIMFDNGKINQGWMTTEEVRKYLNSSRPLGNIQ